MGEVNLVFLHKLRFQFHLTETINLTVDIVVALDQTDTFNAGTDF